ncbi:TadE family type IV pilus minor pilin [Williamsia sterculiae]|uniref:TadE-like protein n=1 Tax=Williamsia sterculiae TaxID=1344003 RepID=A0A1N7F3C9_9NOCA|nr:TadE family type IV pilus minor pilin [Williamsia sterculiae]SIR94848.1 hypothetical protein SAMN05445060_1767 [Williamsia sterculiae]
MSTVEGAFAIASIVVTVLFAVAGVGAVTAHVRCVDAAREIARLSALGDDARAQGMGRQVAPADATVSVRRDGEMVRVRVSVGVPLLPLLDVSADAVAATEPSGDGAAEGDR